MDTHLVSDIKRPFDWWFHRLSSSSAAWATALFFLLEFASVIVPNSESSFPSTDSVLSIHPEIADNTGWWHCPSICIPFLSALWATQIPWNFLYHDFEGCPCDRPHRLAPDSSISFVRFLSIDCQCDLSVGDLWASDCTVWSIRSLWCCTRRLDISAPVDSLGRRYDISFHSWMTLIWVLSANIIPNQCLP